MCWLPTLISGETKESKNQNKNSSNNSLRLSVSETLTRCCCLAPEPGGASQSQSDVLMPCRTLCKLRVSKRRPVIKSLISGHD